VALQLPGIWNDFMMPLLFLRGKYRKTLTLLVYNFTRDHESDYGAIFALIVIGMILPVSFYIVARRAIDRSIGATVGGVKG
jgi:raffinose/stachyose/melibiose transport system permease protein